MLNREAVVTLFAGLGLGMAISLGCAGTDQQMQLEKDLDLALEKQKNAKPAECYPGIEEPCYGGAEGTAGRGICREGKRTCDAKGFWMACEGEVLPAQTEMCDGVDNDCNGVIDDGMKRAGTKCWNGQGECRSEGVYECSADKTESVCNAPEKPASNEICDGKDNDCDGEIDEGDVEGTGAQCTTGQAGACNAGTKQCIAGEIKCMPLHIRSLEICGNNLDDDCDGQVDEKGCATAEEAAAAKR